MVIWVVMRLTILLMRNDQSHLPCGSSLSSLQRVSLLGNKPTGTPEDCKRVSLYLQSFIGSSNNHCVNPSYQQLESPIERLISQELWKKRKQDYSSTLYNVGYACMQASQVAQW